MRVGHKNFLMSIFVGVVLSIVALPGVAQQTNLAVDAVLLEKGRQLYGTNCSACHQSGGIGVPPLFPAFVKNEKLRKLELIVSNIRQGEKNMPAFPDLTAQEIAALATYIRNTWGNAFGGASTEQVTASLQRGGKIGKNEIGTKVPVWGGIYTKEQAARGMQVLRGSCAACHGTRGDGASEPDYPTTPAIARASFLRKWDGRTVALLFTYVKATMPLQNPGSLSDQQYVDVLAHMLALSNIPAGEKELVANPEALAGFLIKLQR